jgi:hypothetical protein
MTVTLRLPKCPAFPRVRFPRLGRGVYEIASQTAGVVTVLVGVAAWSVPCALILGGLTVVLAVERQT